MSAITCHQNPISYCIRGNLEFVSKTPALRNAHSMLGSYITSKGARVRKGESHQNCERLRHLTTCQAVVLRSEIKVMFDLHNFSFASSLSHIWVTNPYPQHGDTTQDRGQCSIKGKVFLD
jgi:hypothetical protein